MREVNMVNENKDGPEVGGQQASEGGGGDSNKTNPVAIERYIKGIGFPANKEDLIQQAQENGAPEDVMDVLNRFDEHEYNSPIDISKEVARIE